MRTHTLSVRSLLSFGLVALTGVGAYYSAVAQETHEVTVEGRRIVGRSDTTNAPISEMTAQRHVNFSDLNLTTQAGATALETRVRSAARSACDELESKSPSKNPTASSSCYREAVDKALGEVRGAIDAAKPRSRES